MDAKNTDACPTAEMLSAFAGGRLGDDDLANVAAHLETCPACVNALVPIDPFTQNLQRIHQDGVTPWSESGPSNRAAADLGPYFFNVTDEPPTKDPEQFFDALARSGLFDADDMKDARREWKAFRSTDIAAFAQTLAMQQRLTEFHVRQLLRGKSHGWVLGDYVILHPLSAGGMGWIFQARHRRKDRTVALKVTPPHLARSRSAIERFRHEIDTIARLRHPRLIAAIDAGEAEGVSYLVMDELQGHSLAEWVELHGPMRVLPTVDMIRQATEAIAAAHEAGIIHRDLNPSKLWIETFTGSGRISASGVGVKVLDFGLAHMIAAESSQRSTGQAVAGTVGYVAPELAKGSGDADERSDLYSLGCTLFFLLSGKPPYHGSHAEQEQFLIPTLESPREPVPAGLQSIYRRLVAKAPADRYRTADDAIVDLDAFLAGTKISSPWPKWVKPAAIGATAALLLVVVGLTWLRPSADAGRDGVVKISGPLPSTLDGPTSPEAIAASQKAWAAALGMPVEITNSLGMKLRLIPPGTTTLGSPPGQIDERLGQLVPGSWQWQWLSKHGPLEKSPRPATLTKPYYLGTTEVTVKQFRAFAGAVHFQSTAEVDGVGVSYSKNLLRRQSPGLNWRTPGYDHQTDDSPVVQISAADAGQFCRWLAQRERRPYSLPTETHWEFACRAGRPERWFWGNDPDAFVDFTAVPDDSWYGPHPVAQKKPNPFGLFDMAGNVAEWCDSNFVRGGAFLHPAPDGLASASRLEAPDPCQDFVGFRVMFEMTIERR